MPGWWDRGWWEARWAARWEARWAARWEARWAARWEVRWHPRCAWLILRPTPSPRPLLRAGYFFIAAACGVTTLGLLLRQPWVARAWPWRDGPLTLTFAAALAAIAAPVAWVATSGEWGVIAGSGLLAAYYLFLHPATRGWSAARGDAPRNAR